MAIRAGLFRNPLIGTEGDPYAAEANPYTGLNPAANIGQDALQPGLADTAVTNMESAQPVSSFELPGMSQPQSVPDVLSGGPLPVTQPTQQAPQLRLGYDPEQRAYLVNNRVIPEQDVEGLRRVPEFLQEPPAEQAPNGNWRPTNLQSIKSWKDQLENVGVGEELRIGARQVAEATVGGLGRGLELLGAERAGGALVRAGEFLGPTEYDEARQAVEREANSLWANMLEAPIEGAPSFATTIGGGVAGFLAGGPIGAAIGAATASFPMLLYGAYESAEQQMGEEFVQSPEGKMQVASVALGNTLLETLGANLALKAFSPMFRRLVQDAAEETVQRSKQSVLRAGAGGALSEGVTEALSQVIEGAAFNPEVRAALSEGEVQALAPIIAEQYGEDAAIAFAGGALLGGPISAGGAALSNRSNVSEGDTTTPEDTTGDTPEPEPTPTPTTPAAPTVQMDLPLEGGEVAPQPTEFAPTEPGTQGVLNIGVPGDNLTAEEAAARGMPPRTQETVTPQPEPQQLDLLEGETPAAPVPQQGALQFAPPPPEGRRFGTVPEVPQTQLAEQMQEVQRQRELQQAEEQRAQQEAAQREADYNRALAQQEQQAAEQAEAQARIEQEVQQQQAERQRGIERLRRGRAQAAATAAPQQQQLFSGREAPRPSRSELLRRGVAQPPQTQPDLVVPEPVQQGLFDEPTQPELPGIPSPVTPEIAGQRWEEDRGTRPGVRRWENLSPERQEEWRQSIERREATPARQREISRAESVARVQPRAEQAAPVAAQQETQAETQAEAQETTDAVQEPSAEEVDVREQAGDGEAVGEGDTQQEAAEAREVQEVQEDQVAEVEGEPEAEVQTEATTEAEPQAEAEPTPTAETQPTPVQQVAAAEASETDLVRMDVAEGVPTSFLMDAAYGADVAKDARAEARKFLDEYVEANGMDDAYIAALQEYAAAESYISSISKTSNLYKMIDSAGLLEWASRKGVIADVKRGQKSQYNKAKFDDDPTGDGRDPHAARLANEIYQYTAMDTKLDGRSRSSMKKKLEGLWKKTKAEGNSDAVLGETEVPLSNYFTSSGKLKTNPLTGRPITREVSKEQARAEEVLARDDAKLAAQEEAIRMEEIRRLEDAERLGRQEIGDDFAQFGLNEDGDVDGFFRRLDTNERITKPVPMGRAKMIVSQFRNRLRIKPNIKLYKNQADLKAKNPQLYEQAKAARGAAADFDTTVAAGYSFGDNQVIIFTDRIPTEQALRFVLAHETIGHLGFRAIVEPAKLDKALDSVYNRDPRAREYVDFAVESRGMSRREATEEYLADMAGSIETNYLARFWNAIKNAIERLTGIDFRDTMARYLVSQSRRYVRNGILAGKPVKYTDIARDALAMESGTDPMNSGRFKTIPEFAQDNIAASGLMKNNIGLPMTRSEFKEWTKQLKSRNKDVFNSWDKFRNVVFRLTTFKARENEGFAELHEAIRQGKDKTLSMKNEMNELMAPVLDRAISAGVKDVQGIGGISEAEYNQLNELLYAAMFRAISRNNDRDLKGPDLYTISEDGTLEPNYAEIERLIKLGEITFEQAKNGFEWTVELPGEETTTRKFGGIKDLTEDSRIWVGYQRTRETIKKTALSYLEAKYLSHTKDVDLSFREMAAFMDDGEFRPNEKRFLERVARRYKQLYTQDVTFDETGTPQYNGDSITAANDFIAAVNAALIGRDTDRNQAVADMMTGRAEETIRNIEAIKARRTAISEENRFLIQNTIRQRIVSEISNEDSGRGVKRTLATGYIPLVRRGEYQVRIVAKDRNGNPVRLKREYKELLSYSQFETESEALRTAQEMNAEVFRPNAQEMDAEVSQSDAENKTLYRVEAFDNETNKYVTMDVELEAVAEVALDAVAAPPELNLNEFVRGLRQLGVTLRPEKMEQLVKSLTAQNARARKRILKRAGTPGFDPDAIRAVTEYVETQAALTGKTLMRPKLNELLNLNLPSTQRKWFGDEAKLNRLKSEYERLAADPNASEDTKHLAKREFEKYAYFYKNTNPEGRASRGNQYFNEAANLISFLENNSQIDSSDFEAGRIVSGIRGFTSAVQLGASVATSALNYIGVYTNAIPALSTYSEKNAFGGGFGLGNSLVEYQKALHQIGLTKAVRNNKLNKATFYEEIAKSETLQKKYGLKPHEALFIAREIREGVMIPALSNSLLGLARGNMRPGLRRKVTDGWMYTFNSTEQSTRRALGLASYRLEYQRLIAAGVSETNAQKQARNFAVGLIEQTVGDYSVMNRPPMWRGPVGSFLYMYKVFPTTSIQTFARLSPKGRVQMMAALFALSGVSGLPFAEDIEDLLDTLAQTFKIPMSSVRVELAKLIDAAAPGMSQAVIFGAIDQFSIGAVGSRTSLGDMVPGSGIFLAGANQTREIQEIAGPAAGMALGVGQTAKNLLSLMSETTTFQDVLRESPVTMLRALGDTLAYNASGAIVDRRGYVLSPDVTAATMLWRLLGFYPNAAASQYNVIMLSQRVANYQREVSASFRTAAVKAAMQGDMEQVRDIREAVREWNEANKNTGLRIDDFNNKYLRALKEARRPGVERFLRTTPLSSRPQIELIEEWLGY